ncbi:hypothetical protein AHAS_Ahas09G0280500 [Arachis hypogaea]
MEKKKQNEICRMKAPSSVHSTPQVALTLHNVLSVLVAKPQQCESVTKLSGRRRKVMSTCLLEMHAKVQVSTFGHAVS